MTLCRAIQIIFGEKLYLCVCVWNFKTLRLYCFGTLRFGYICDRKVAFIFRNSMVRFKDFGKSHNEIVSSPASDRTPGVQF